MTKTWSKRCLGWHCSINKDCAHYVRESVPNEQIFQSYPAGEMCMQFQPWKEERFGVGRDID